MIAWGLQHGLKAHAHLALREIGATGERTVSATAPIFPGDEIFRIPAKLLISASNVFSQRLGPQGAEYAHPDSDDGLAYAVLTELREQLRSGVPSFWSPYFVTMPTKFNTPIFFNSTERRKLRGSELVHWISQREREILRSQHVFEQYVGLQGSMTTFSVGGNEGLSAAQRNQPFGVRDVAQILSLIWSRCFLAKMRHRSCVPRGTYASNRSSRRLETSSIMPTTRTPMSRHAPSLEI